MDFIENAEILYVFETLLRNNSFMTRIDHYIKNTIFSNKKFDSKDIQELVLIITRLLLDNPEYIDYKYHIKNNKELVELLELFFDYILSKINECIKYYNFNNNIVDNEGIKYIYDICVRLVILKFKYSKQNGFFCIGKK